MAIFEQVCERLLLAVNVDYTKSTFQEMAESWELLLDTVVVLIKEEEEVE